MSMTNRNPYISFPSEILDVIKHTEKEYTFRMAFQGDVKPGQFFEVSIPKFGEAPISVSGIEEGVSVDLTIGIRAHEGREPADARALWKRL